MYKNFKSYRHYLNARLHAISITLCGDNFVLEELLLDVLKRRPITSSQLHLTTKSLPTHFSTPSVKDLTDAEAESLYRQMLNLLQGQTLFVKETGINGHVAGLTDRQRRAIISLMKYKLNMSPSAAFAYILDTFPNKRQRLTPYEIQKCRLTKLYSLLSQKEANILIKRLIEFNKKSKYEKKS